MGQEKQCSLVWDGRPHQGKALLESSELIFRGDFSLKILFSEIQEISAADGNLLVRTPRGSAVFTLGELAEKWRHRISNPKTVVEKLGVKPAEHTVVLGKFEPNFLNDLKKTTGKTPQGKMSRGAGFIFLLADSAKALATVKAIAAKMQGASALWIVYPKGQKGITESGVRKAGLKAKLVDVKVVSFSPSHTALKFVIPKARR
jgi:hypothetical protein